MDNSAASTGDSDNPYACENTNDKVFLLSYSDATNTNYGFDSDWRFSPSRVAKPTDYALARGAYQYNGVGLWWLRSPDSGDSSLARYVDDGGHVGSSDVYYADDCVRPALKIKK